MEIDAAQERISIVLLPSGDIGAQVLATARAWAAMGILARALWVLPGEVLTEETGPAGVGGLLLDRDQSSTVNVFDILARSDLSLVQLVVLQVLDAEHPADPVQRNAANQLFDALQAALPRALSADSRRETRVRLTALNLISAPTGLAGLDPQQIVFPQFTGNLLATPEDRRCADQVDRFVRPGQPQRNWALAQTIAVAGLWAGMSEFPWEVLSTIGGRHSAATEPTALIVPVRSYGRIVSSAPMARAALASAMESLRGQTRNVVVDDALLPLTDSSSLIDQVLAALDSVDEARMVYLSPEETPDPARNKVDFSVAIGSFREFSAEQLSGVPSYFRERTRRGMGSASTSLLSGERGHEYIVFDGEQMTEEDFRQDFARQATANEVSLTAIKTGPPAAAPELWRTVRGATFSLLDGSPMPQALPAAEVSGQQVVVTGTNLIVPPPNRWSSEVGNDPGLAKSFGLSDWSVGPCSVREYRHAQIALAAVLAATAARTSQLQGRLAKLTGGDTAAALQMQLVQTQAVETLAHRNLMSLAGWHGQRAASMLWRMTSTIVDRSEGAGRDKDEAYAVATAVPELDFSEPRRARGQFVRRLLVAAAIWLLAVVISVPLGAKWASAIGATVVLWWVMLFVLGGLALLLILLASYRRRSRFLRKISQLRHSQRDAARRCRESTYAQNRLAGLSEQAAEWGEILGQTVYEPWAVDPRWRDGAPDAQTIAGLPACVDFALPNPDDGDSNRRLENLALRTVASRGWRARSYERLAELAMRAHDPLATTIDLAQLDLDAPASPNGSRQQMLVGLRGTQSKAAAATTVLSTSLGVLYEDRIALVRHTVQAQNGELAPERTHILDEGVGLRDATPRWQDFLAEVRSGQTELSLATWSGVGETDTVSRATLTTVLWMPDRLLDDGNPAGRPVGDVWERSAMPAVGNRGVELASRLDIGAPVEPNHLRIFSHPFTDIYLDSERAASDRTRVPGERDLNFFE